MSNTWLHEQGRVTSTAVKRRKSFNPTRRIRSDELSPAELQRLAEGVRYGGNPEHKGAPGDFCLTPPASPRPDKTLCDGAGVF